MESKIDLIKKHTTENLTNDGLLVKVDYSAAMDEYSQQLMDSNRKLREALEIVKSALIASNRPSATPVVNMITQTLNETGV